MYLFFCLIALTHVFDSSGLYLATKKIGKNNPKAEQIRTDSENRMRWNREVDRAIVSSVPETEIQQIKKEYITDRIRESVDIFGSQPERLQSIIMTAVAALCDMTRPLETFLINFERDMDRDWNLYGLSPLRQALHSNRWKQPASEFLWGKYLSNDPLKMYVAFRIRIKMNARTGATT